MNAELMLQSPLDTNDVERLNGSQDSGIGEGEITCRGTPVLQEYTLEDVSKHSDNKSCWVVFFDYVYDLTEFLHEHPGGWEIIMEHAGADGTGAFRDKGHSAHAKELMKKYCIGQLVEAERLCTNEKRW
ncbi:cytochrome b5-like [Amphiura filiformis]|uniref:cytochrome b5-like n=1 Tax=Amphiura filiformis TaxID=82378 RepID=UPI003B21C18A